MSDPIPYYYYVYKINTDAFQISLTPITGTVTPVVLTLTLAAVCHRIAFRLLLTRDPKGFGVSAGDYLQLVQTGYNYNHLITEVISEYNYCSEEYTFGIDFITGILPIPTVKTEGAAGLPSLSATTTYTCKIDESIFQISYINSIGSPLAHGLSDADIIFFLSSVGNIDAYTNYYVSNAHPLYFEISQSMTPWGKTLTVIANDTWQCATAHGLNNGNLVIFSNAGGGVVSGQHYLVTNVTTTTFQIRDITTSSLVPLTLAGNNIISYSSIAITNIKNTTNTYMVSGTRVISKEIGYQHRYSLIQHLLWRLDNEVNGNDLPLVYGLTTTQLAEKKLDNYKGVKDGIIWPTPHFKYGFDISTEDIVNFPPDDVVDLVLKKLKQYKPKHTVADLTIGYPLDGNQVAITPMIEVYETENLMSDAYRTFNGVTNNIMNIITAKHHDLKDGETIYIEFGTAVGITFGTLYYVKYIDADSFQISLSSTLAPLVTITGITTIAITLTPESDYRIVLNHDTALPSNIDKTYDLPIITLDVARDYGSTADFYYIFQDGTVDEATIYYAPFLAYPQGLKTDVWRNRKRALGYLD